MLGRLIWTLCKCTAAFTLLFASIIQAAESPQDFTGVWLAFASETAISTRDILTGEGTTLVADFTALYPNMVEPASYCVTPGMPATMTSIEGYPIEFLHSANRLTLLAENQKQVRRIFLDDRDHPADYPASRMGHSIGAWEGNTLVINTVGLAENLIGLMPSTETTTIIERVTKITRAQVSAQTSGFITTSPLGDDVLAINLTISDPALYAKSQTVTVYYQRIEDTGLVKFDCSHDLWQQALKEANQ